MKYAILTVEFKVKVKDNIDIDELEIDIDLDAYKLVRIGDPLNGPPAGNIIGYETVNAEPLGDED
jgi:hypothetical protein